jgi:hypothetical protein
MNRLGGNPIDQGDPGQAGGIPFSLIAILCIILLVLAGLWIFITNQLPNLVKVKSLKDLKIWIKEFWGGLLFVIIGGLLLGLIALLLAQIGL